MAPEEKKLPPDVVAMVNGVSISKAAFDQKTLEAQNSSSSINEWPEPKELLEDLINHELIAQEALKGRRDLNGKEKQAQRAILAQGLAKSQREKIRARLTVKRKEILDYSENGERSEKINLRQIVLNNGKQAQEILDDLKGGGDFTEKALKFSLEGVERGVVGRGDLILPLESVAFALEPGEISSVVPTSFGFYIYKRIPLSEEYVRNQVLKEKGKAAWDKWINKLRSQAEIVINKNLFS